MGFFEKHKEKKIEKEAKDAGLSRKEYEGYLELKKTYPCSIDRYKMILEAEGVGMSLEECKNYFKLAKYDTALMDRFLKALELKITVEQYEEYLETYKHIYGPLEFVRLLAAREEGLTLKQYDERIAVGLSKEEYKDYLDNYENKYSTQRYKDFLSAKEVGLSEEQYDEYYENNYYIHFSLKEFLEIAKAREAGLPLPIEYRTTMAMKNGLNLYEYDRWYESYRNNVPVEEAKEYFQRLEAEEEGLTLDEYAECIASGLSLEDYKNYLENYKTKYTVQRYKDFLSAKEVGLSEEQIDEYYENDYDLYYQPEKFLEIIKAEAEGLPLPIDYKKIHAKKNKLSLEEYDRWYESYRNTVPIEEFGEFWKKHTKEEKEKAKALAAGGKKKEDQTLASKEQKEDMRVTNIVAQRKNEKKTSSFDNSEKTINRAQFEGTHDVKKRSEQVFVDSTWSIEIPKGYTYSMDDNFTAEMMINETHYLLQAQDTETCNLHSRYSAEFNFVVFPYYHLLDVFTCDLLSSRGKKGIKQFLDRITHIKKKKLVHTKEIAVYYGFSKNTKDVTECTYYVLVRGVSCAYQGQFVIYTGTKEEREKEICRWLNTIKPVSYSLTGEEFRCLHRGKKEQISFEENNYVTVADNLKIAVADNFKYLVGKKTVKERKLIVVPKNYSFEKSPMDAAIGFSITRDELSADFEQNKLEVYFNVIVDKMPVEFFFLENPVHTVKEGKDGAILYQVFYDYDEKFTKCNAIFFSGDKIFFGFCCINHNEGTHNGLTYLEDMYIINTWLSKCKYKNEPEDIFESDLFENIPKLDFTATEAEDTLYPHYRNLLNIANQYQGLGGVRVEVNASGTECAFTSLESELDYQEDFEDDEDFALPKEIITAYRHCIEADNGTFSCAAVADECRKLFRVNENAFDYRHDRECEIKSGQIHRAYMVSALRSFAWTLADYCKKYNIEPANVDFGVLRSIIEFCEDRDWLNYDDKHYCQGLCKGSDLNGYYVPQQVSVKDIKVLLPNADEIQEANYAEILPEVHFLEPLRDDLAYLKPAIVTLWNELAQNRDYNKPLTGNIADIVYAWCSYALAAQKPFFMCDGPMTNCFIRYTDESKYDAGMLAKKNAPKAGGCNSKVIQSNIADFNIAGRTVTKYKGKDDSIAIPEGVVIIGDSAFSKLKNLKTVELPSTVKTIGKKAFEHCEGLREIYIANGIETIEKGAFSYCENLKTINLPQTLKSIGEKAFYRCEFLTYISIPDGVTKIGKEAFCNCENLTDIYVPMSVVQFNKDAFETKNIDQDTVIHTPAGSAAEKYATKCKLSVDNNMTGLGEIQESLLIDGGYLIMKDKIIDYKSDSEHIIIPEGIVKIEGGAFSKSKKLKTVELPQTLKSIGAKAFKDCLNLEEMIVPEGVVEIKKNAFKCCKKLKKMELPQTLEKIESEVFQDCRELEEVKLPQTLKVISEGTFSRCYKLKIVLPESLNEIGDYAFHACQNIETINLPHGLKKIGEGAFLACESLTEICIPEGVEEIKDRTFHSCQNLKMINLPHGLKKIGEGAFSSCESLTEICIPEGIEEIKDRTFWGCKNLKDVYITTYDIEVSDSAFDFCNEDVTIHTLVGSAAAKYAERKGISVKYDAVDPKI